MRFCPGLFCRTAD